MAVGIGSLIYVPILSIGAVVVALFQKRPAKTYLLNALILGFTVGAAQGIAIIKKDIAKYKSKPAQSTVLQASPPSKADLQTRMTQIMTMVKGASSKADHATRAEFYKLAKEYVGDNDEKLRVLKFNLATAPRVYKDWVFKDAADSYKLGRPIKSARRTEIEKAMLESNPDFQEQIDLDNSFVELVARRKPLNTVGTPLIYTAEDIQRGANQSQATWTAVESLFEPPE